MSDTQAQVGTLGGLLRAFRTWSDLSQKAAASAIGISPQYLNDIERDRRIPSHDVCSRMADAYSLSPQYLDVLCGRIPEDIARRARLNSSVEVVAALEEARQRLDDYLRRAE